MLRKIFLFASVVSVLSVFVVVFVVGLFYHTYWYHLKRGLALNDKQMIQLIQSGLHTPLKQTDYHTNFLLLGVDALPNRDGDPILTDTIILVSLDLVSMQLRAISIPRDLWSVEYKTKINALYQYGKERNLEHPEEFPTQVLSDLTQVPIHYTVVISLEDLKALVDLLGGVTVDVKKGFVDDQFPRSDVDIRTVHDPAQLYQTVSFEPGIQKMNGERVLQYIRSRKSSDLEAGTDDARTLRQQEIILALIEKVKQVSVVTAPNLIEELASWYRVRFARYFPYVDAIAIANVFGFVPSDLFIQPEQLSVESDQDPGVIYHPSVLKYKVWVYEVKNIDEFRQELFTKLGLPYNKSQ